MTGIVCSMVGATFSVAAAAQILRSKKGITAVGSAVTVSTTQSKFGGSSAYFNGSSYFSSSSSSDFAFGTGDFTIECWVYPTATPPTWRPILSLGSASGGNLIRFNQDFNGTGKWGVLIPANGGGDAYTLYSASALTLNTWTHIACVRSGSTVTIYANGSQAAQLTSQTWSYTNTAGLTAGFGMYGSDGYYYGYIDEIRVSKTARYTAAFTAPTQPFVNDDNTVLLIHANGTNATTFFEDDNGSTTLRTAKTITAFNNAQLDTAQQKFGQSSLLFDGTADYFEAVPPSTETFGTGDFTVEFWYRPAVIGAIQSPIGNRISPTGPGLWWVEIGADGTAYAAYQNTAGTSYYPVSPGTYAINTWYHIAIVRSGGTLTFYRNGVGGTAVTGVTGTFHGAGTSYYIGGQTSAYNVNGWMDEIRISNVARYTANFTAPTTTFANDANTLLLIHADGADASTTITDDNSGRAPLGLIAQNQTQISTAQSKFGGSSLVFDGNDDWISIPSMPGITGNYTIECWARFDILPWNQTLDGGSYMMLATGSGGDYILVYRSGAGSQVQVQIAIANKYGSFTKSGVNLAINTWYHIAVVRNNGVFKVFFDGVDLTTFTNDSGFTNSGRTENIQYTIIGRFIDARGSWDGYMDEIRISNTARYTADFTPSTTPFVNDANTVLLVHADGTNASTVFRDDNGIIGKNITVVGNAQIDTAQSQFGGSSALFDGAGDKLTIIPTGSFAYSGDFTIEAWVRPATFANAQVLFSQGSAEASMIAVYLESGTGQIIYYAYGASRITSGTNATVNTWQHIAVSRSGSSIRLFRNGTQIGSTYTDTTSILDATFNIGTWINDTSGWNGHIDEFRVSNSARYTANFTAPTAAFASDANTLLLLHMDGVDAATTFVDSTSRTQKGIQALGNAQIDTAQSKFGGSSALFDGNADALQIIPLNANDLAIGSGDFTIEFFVRFTSSTSTGVLVDTRGNPQNGSGWCVYVSSSTIRWYFNTGDRITSSSISNGVWYHIALVRSGNDHKLYIDGTQSGATYTSANTYVIGSSTLGLWLGQSQPFPTQGLVGHMDEVRISNTARYTAAFTPTTVPFQNDDSTVLLLHADGTNASTAFFDDNGAKPYTP